MIDAPMVRDMVIHWLSTPVNHYFGSSYGADLTTFLLKPLTTPSADAFLRKLKNDIPSLAELTDDQLSIQSENIGFDRVNVWLMIGRIAIQLQAPSIGQNNPEGATFRVDAS